MLNGAFKYSTACKHVNKMAKINVNKSPAKVCFLARVSKAWCDHVTVAPELNRMKVLVKGTV